MMARKEGDEDETRDAAPAEHPWGCPVSHGLQKVLVEEVLVEEVLVEED